MSKRTKIEQDVEIIIMNNVRGSFFYKSRSGDLILDLDEFGDEEYVTFADLKRIMASNRAILETLKIVIVDVDSDDYTIDDVVAALRLSDSYNELKSVCDGEFGMNSISDYINTASEEELGKILSSSKTKLKNNILETAVVMYREGSLTDYNKMKLFAEKIGRKDFSSYWLDANLPETVTI